MNEADLAQREIEMAEHIREQDRLARMATDIRLLSIVDCEECGEPIGDRRKEALPKTVHCIDCAERNERVGVRYRRLPVIDDD